MPSVVDNELTYLRQVLSVSGGSINDLRARFWGGVADGTIIIGGGGGGGPIAVADVTGLQAALDAIYADITSVEGGISTLSTTVGGLDTEVGNLDTSVTAAVAGLSSRWRDRGAFASATAYAVNDIVRHLNGIYRCMTAHTSGGGPPSTDGDPTYWERIITITTTGLVWSASSITSGRLAAERLPAGAAMVHTNPATRPTSDPDVVVFYLTATQPTAWLNIDIWLATP